MAIIPSFMILVLVTFITLCKNFALLQQLTDVSIIFSLMFNAVPVIATEFMPLLNAITLLRVIKVVIFIIWWFCKFSNEAACILAIHLDVFNYCVIDNYSVASSRFQQCIFISIVDVFMGVHHAVASIVFAMTFLQCDLFAFVF